ncbi:hypothetical protein [Williamsia sp. DF01-3]|uniref:hypothetical protein n=1 Tax=Williamsia sp. DF01-3 TaxID=2934157 RepID=UPI001FF1BACC|nr:hypothetical protein [Williamsia sp. DF01-3]MCK0519016.1 hypothetical protein [Williamsia sp. DF01-3]
MKTFQKNTQRRLSKKYVLKRFHNPNQTKTDTTTGLKTCDGIKKTIKLMPAPHTITNQTPEEAQPP